EEISNGNSRTRLADAGLFLHGRRVPRHDAADRRIVAGNPGTMDIRSDGRSAYRRGDLQHHADPARRARSQSMVLADAVPGLLLDSQTPVATKRPRRSDRQLAPAIKPQR